MTSPSKHDGQSSSARPSTKSRKTPTGTPIVMGKDKSSKANKTPSTGMGR